jgi:hypothetical protein
MVVDTDFGDDKNGLAGSDEAIANSERGRCARRLAKG